MLWWWHLAWKRDYMCTCIHSFTMDSNHMQSVVNGFYWPGWIWSYEDAELAAFHVTFGHLYEPCWSQIKGTQRGNLGAFSMFVVKCCIYCGSVPSLRRDSLISNLAGNLWTRLVDSWSWIQIQLQYYKSVAWDQYNPPLREQQHSSIVSYEQHSYVLPR